MGQFGGSIIQSASAGLQAVVGHDRINKANETVQQGYTDSNKTLTDQYGKTQAYLDPYATSGTQATTQLSDLTKPGGEFSTGFNANGMYNDPGYQFRMDEGRKNIERGASAKGGLFNGGTLKALSRYGQDYASNEYNNAYGRFMNDRNTRYSQLSDLANRGMGASSQQAGYSQRFGDAISGNNLGAAHDQAASTMADYRNWQEQDSRAAGAWSGQKMTRSE